MSKRIIYTVELNAVIVKVYRDSDWQEWQVVPFLKGVKLDDCTSFHDSKADAIGSADYTLNWFNNEGLSYYPQ